MKQRERLEADGKGAFCATPKLRWRPAIFEEPPLIKPPALRGADSLTASPVVRLNPRGRLDAYVIGGAGFYRRTLEFTQPAVAAVTVLHPFLGVFTPVAIPVNGILDSSVQNKPGLNIGTGVTVRLRSDSAVKFFAEACSTTVLPVTFGLRW